MATIVVHPSESMVGESYSNTKSMKGHNTILHVMGMPSSKYGGIERFCVELASQLNHHGYHSVFIFESTPNNQDFIGTLSFVSSLT